MPTTQQTCPICSNADAKYMLIDHDDKKHFKCPTCLEFVVTVSDEKALIASPLDFKARLSALSASAEKDHRLEISRRPGLGKTGSLDAVIRPLSSASPSQ